MFPEFGPWLTIRDGDPTVWPLFQRHYSARKNGGHRRTGPDLRFVGPCEKLVLTTLNYDALFA